MGELWATQGLLKGDPWAITISPWATNELPMGDQWAITINPWNTHD